MCIYQGKNYPRGNCLGTNFRGAIGIEGNWPGGDFLGAIGIGDNCPGGIVPGAISGVGQSGNCPVPQTKMSEK